MVTETDEILKIDSVQINMKAQIKLVKLNWSKLTPKNIENIKEIN